MPLPRWLRRLMGETPHDPALPPRHERREVVRERHAAGGPGWSDGDRHESVDGTRIVEDITPGTPGWGGSRRTRGG